MRKIIILGSGAGGTMVAANLRMVRRVVELDPCKGARILDARIEALHHRHGPGVDRIVSAQ